MFNYRKIRLSSTMQRYSAKIVIMCQSKIARVSGWLQDCDVDLDDIVANVRHVNNATQHHSLSVRVCVNYCKNVIFIARTF